jgi:hypothetical protein
MTTTQNKIVQNKSHMDLDDIAEHVSNMYKDKKFIDCKLPSVAEVGGKKGKQLGPNTCGKKIAANALIDVIKMRIDWSINVIEGKQNIDEILKKGYRYYNISNSNKHVENQSVEIRELRESIEFIKMEISTLQDDIEVDNTEIINKKNNNLTILEQKLNELSNINEKKINLKDISLK